MSTRFGLRTEWDGKAGLSLTTDPPFRHRKTNLTELSSKQEPREGRYSGSRREDGEEKGGENRSRPASRSQDEPSGRKGVEIES